MTDLSERRESRQQRRGTAPRPGRETAIRVLDIAVSLVAVLAAAPLLAVLWVLVRATSRGPGLFRQERVGRNLQPFTMLKLRSMYIRQSDQLHRECIAGLVSGERGPGAHGLFKLEADPRVTPVGAWLRRTSMDELPQLLNVLKGDMSLVGPRPALSWEVEMWPSTYPDYKRRFEVRPGMTGLWQVSGRSKLPMQRWLELDAEYVQRRSFALNLVILARTLPALFRGGAS